VKHPPLGHFYHVYAAGAWEQPVTEHCRALADSGLLTELDTWQVGFVGTAEQIAAVRCTLDVLAPGYEICAEAPEGWEQTTLEPLWKFSRHFDGLISYAHTKGASRSNPVDLMWRRCMTYHAFVNWQRPVEALMNGAAIAGSHWIHGATVDGHISGMFGGNYWWTWSDILRKNPPPDVTSRWHAEHWLGQIGEHTDLHDRICDLNTEAIGRGCPDWYQG
jgi:hypothetical protein